MSHEFLKQSKDGVLLLLHVQPGARKSGIRGIHDGRLKLAVDAPPVDGKANKACRLFLAKALGVPKSRIRLLAGETSRRKTFLVEGLEVSEARRLLTQ